MPSAKYGTTVVGVGGRWLSSRGPTTRNGQLYAVPGIGKRASSPRTDGRGARANGRLSLGGALTCNLRAARCGRCGWTDASFAARTVPLRPVVGSGRLVGRAGRADTHRRSADGPDGLPISPGPPQPAHADPRCRGKEFLLQDGSGRPLTLVDTATGTRQQIDWPKTVGSLDAPAVDIGGRRIAVAFANPSWTGRRDRRPTYGSSTPRLRG